ncbi:F0F1 ATP synthase subunit gamma [Phaeospirillum tilakii]|uniref:F0F1 ATP synthase subunit gamma n=1 Tax=Phaeospirillum tilakii TaxID=741673 RepID=A0ABW5CDT0_9PROT
MDRPETVRARIDSVAQLQEVVGAMRSLAAMRMQQASESLDGIRRYAAIVAAGLAQALRLAGGAAPPRRGGRRALLLFSAEHGFVGAYAETLAEAARADPPDLLLAVGTKGIQALTEAGLTPDWSLPMASHAGGVEDLARRIAAELARRLGAGAFTRLDLLFGRIGAGGGWQPVRRPLFPPDFADLPPPRGSTAPLHHLPAPALLDRLIEERLLADLALAATEALAAENAARLAAMTTAGDNIDRKLTELRDQERILRQAQITEELLDVVNGAELLFEKEEEVRRRPPPGGAGATVP